MPANLPLLSQYALIVSVWADVEGPKPSSGLAFGHRDLDKEGILESPSQRDRLQDHLPVECGLASIRCPSSSPFLILSVPGYADVSQISKVQNLPVETIEQRRESEIRRRAFSD
jgi:hypothetical protein